MIVIPYLDDSYNNSYDNIAEHTESRFKSTSDNIQVSSEHPSLIIARLVVAETEHEHHQH